MITVKANQKLLHQRLAAISRDCVPVSVYQHVEQGHQRLTHRTVEVFACLAGIASDWLGLQRFVRVHRQGLRGGKPDSQWSYDITSIATTAQQFAEGIRGHWGIENRLPWVKDVVLREDACPLKLAQAPENWGLIRTWVVNLFRLQGEASITKAQRRVAHDLQALFRLIQ